LLEPKLLANEGCLFRLRNTLARPNRTVYGRACRFQQLREELVRTHVDNTDVRDGLGAEFEALRYAVTPRNEE
jgi:hypothetical protein